MDYLTLGQVPANEECGCVGEANYPERSQIECRVWANQLLRVFPIPEILSGEVYYKIKTFDHDMGMYREVCIVFNDGIRAAVDMAFNVENNAPLDWDDEAKTELAAALKEAGLPILEQQTA